MMDMIDFDKCRHIFGLRIHILNGQGSLICVSCGIKPIGTMRWTNVSTQISRRLDNHGRQPLDLP